MWCISAAKWAAAANEVAEICCWSDDDNDEDDDDEEEEEDAAAAAAAAYWLNSELCTWVGENIFGYEETIGGEDGDDLDEAPMEDNWKGRSKKFEAFAELFCSFWKMLQDSKELWG